MNEYGIIKKGNKVLKIFTDESPSDPREEDNLSKFVLSHKKYSLPNELNLNFKDFDSLGSITEHLEKKFKAKVIKIVKGYDHGGLWVSLSNEYPFNDFWDSGVLGFVCVLEKDIKKEFGKVTKQTIKKAEQILISEFERYKDFLEGNVYGYELIGTEEVKQTIITEHKNGKTDKVTNTVIEEKLIDSCYGFYGNDGLNQIKAETGFKD